MKHKIKIDLILKQTLNSIILTYKDSKISNVVNLIKTTESKGVNIYNGPCKFPSFINNIRRMATKRKKRFKAY